MTDKADRARAMEAATEVADDGAECEKYRNLSRAFIEVVGENERLRGALMPEPLRYVTDADRFIYRDEQGEWNCRAFCGSDHEKWANAANRYETITGTRVDE